jgi:beta-lactam-binding protein with PASTA domain
MPRRSLLALSLLCLALCAGPLFAQAGSSADSAKALSFEKLAQFSIREKGASAWFKVQVGKAGYLRLLLAEEPEDLDVYYDTWSFDAFEGEKKLSDARAAALPTRVEPGEIWIRIHDQWDDEFDQKAYGFRATLQTELDGSEPNDVASRARSIELGAAFKLQIAQKGDADWLALELSETGLLLLELSPRDAPKDIDFRWSIHRAGEGDSILELRSGRPCSELNGYFVEEPGRYLLRVYDEWQDEWSFTEATFRARLLPQTDARENNDSAEQASPLGLPFREEIQLYPIGDQDYFTLTLPEAGTLTLRTEDRGGLADIDLYVQLLRRKESGELEELAKANKLPHDFALEAETAYFLRITDEWNDEASLGGFTLVGTAKNVSGEEIAVDVAAPAEQAPIAVPNLLGMSKDEAFDALTHAGLVPVLLGDKAAEVEGQLPKAGTMLDAGARVAIYCPSPNARVQVPRVIGKDDREAKSMLSGCGFAIKTTGLSGRVIRQDPEENTWHPKGTVVHLWLQRTAPIIKPIPQRPNISARQWTVPNLIGKQLGELGISIGAGHFKVERANRGGGAINRQEPAAGSKATRGSTIRVWLAPMPSGPPSVKPPQPKPEPKPEPEKEPKLLRVPKVIGMWKMPAADLLRRQGFQVRFVGRAVGRVTKQDPGSSRELPHGAVITLTIGR